MRKVLGSIHLFFFIPLFFSLLFFSFLSFSPLLFSLLLFPLLFMLIPPLKCSNIIVALIEKFSLVHVDKVKSQQMVSCNFSPDCQDFVSFETSLDTCRGSQFLLASSYEDSSGVCHNFPIGKYVCMTVQWNLYKNTFGISRFVLCREVVLFQR